MPPARDERIGRTQAARARPVQVVPRGGLPGTVATKICSTCHEGTKLAPFPRQQNSLNGFSHDRHIDPKARLDPSTRMRADCSFCHKLAADGRNERIPGHTQCAACHSKPGMHPEMNAFVRTASCRGCHAPEQLEPSVVVAKSYPAIRF